jgi:hypothetical protein
MRCSPVAIVALVFCGNFTYAAIFPDSGPTTPVRRPRCVVELLLRQLRHRLQSSGRFGRQTNCARNHIATAAAMPPFTIAVTIVPELFRMLWAVLG